MLQSKIELGVSLYCFTEQWADSDGFGFEDMFKELNRLGITKFEIVGSQMFNSYPIVADEEVNHLLDLCKKYNVTPFSYAGQVDGGKFSDHDMTDEEIIGEATFDLMTAYKLGCKYMRGYGIPNHLVKQVAQMAAYYDIKVGFEIHAPSRPSDANVEELVNIIKESGSKHIGLVPDFGCFIEKPNVQMLRNLLNEGANSELLDFIVANRHTGYTEESLWEKVEQMGGKQIEKLAISQMFGFLSFAPADLEGFKTLLPYCLYFHAKFYHIGEDCIESTIPYDKLIQLIVESGFEGVMMTEYEGHCFYLNDAPEQIERHLQMEKGILNSINYHPKNTEERLLWRQKALNAQ